ncbi:MAG: class I SAM-dependent methyltransferase [Ilumatobacter sp.]|nr:class I SAM-dependent methyltransferase [Ilumatobacter sp.]
MIRRSLEDPHWGDWYEPKTISGVVTRALAAGLNESVSITATDLNQPMLDHAEAMGTAGPVEWQQADVMNLPFPDASFDVVVCQFGVMFFPDKVAAHAEVARVLRPGGTYLFTVWDAIEQNEFVHVVERSLAELFPSDPPRFMSRTPHGYHDDAVLRADLAMCGGFASVTIDTVDAHSRAATCHIPARAYLEGTPLRAEVEALDPNGLAVALEVSAAALTQRFGSVDPVGKIRGFVVTATKSGLLPTVQSGFLSDIEPRE